MNELFDLIIEYLKSKLNLNEYAVRERVQDGGGEVDFYKGSSNDYTRLSVLEWKLTGGVFLKFERKKVGKGGLAYYDPRSPINTDKYFSKTQKKKIDVDVYDIDKAKKVIDRFFSTIETLGSYAQRFAMIGLREPDIEIDYKKDSEDQVIVKQLLRIANTISHNGDYGDLYWNPKTKTVWWVSADGDGNLEDGYDTPDMIKEKLMSVKGVKKVEVEAEGYPTGDDWFAITQETVPVVKKKDFSSWREKLQVKSWTDESQKQRELIAEFFNKEKMGYGEAMLKEYIKRICRRHDRKYDDDSIEESLNKVPSRILQDLYNKVADRIGKKSWQVHKDTTIKEMRDVVNKFLVHYDIASTPSPGLLSMLIAEMEQLDPNYDQHSFRETLEYLPFDFIVKWYHKIKDVER